MIRSLIVKFIENNVSVSVGGFLLSLVEKSFYVALAPWAYRWAIMGVGAGGYGKYIIAVYFFDMLDSTARVLFKTLKIKINLRNKSIGVYDYMLSEVVRNSKKFFSSKSPTVITNTIFKLSGVFMEVVGNIILNIAPGIIILCVYTLCMLNVNRSVFYAALLNMLAFQLFFVYIDKKIVDRFRPEDRDEISLSDELEDVFSNIDSVKAFNGEKREIINFLNKKSASLKKISNNERIFAIVRFVEDMLYAIINIAFFLLIFNILGDNAGNLIFIYFSLKNLNRQNMEFTKSIFTLNKNLNRIKDFIGELTDEHRTANCRGAIPLRKTTGEIIFSNVCFRYRQGLPFVFENFNLEIKPNQKIGLTGPSGAGKSTLIGLLLRFYDVVGGNIYIDGRSIGTDITQESLRRNISYIPQDAALFRRTIWENIAYGKPGATNKEVKEACERAFCYDFIMSLENKFDTVIGGRDGIKLSGGQRQRIAIARGILKNSKILIFDEAVSNLDSETEQKIQGSIKNILEDKTVIAATHRLSALSNMDRIIALGDGKIIEDGAFAELLKIEDGFLKKMQLIQRNGKRTSNK
ncbi:MAG: ABC transporter ATP-binding protein/permease [Rickettsiales bacterium]|nr:ABC transporter ATP-binding protein/permease [Rickettsiales bacterium]